MKIQFMEIYYWKTINGKWQSLNARRRALNESAIVLNVYLELKAANSISSILLRNVGFTNFSLLEGKYLPSYEIKFASNFKLQSTHKLSHNLRK